MELYKTTITRYLLIQKNREASQVSYDGSKERYDLKRVNETLS